MDIQLLHDVVAVRVNRPGTDVQQVGYRLVGPPLGNQLENLPFP
jgi:hypothetical protein